MKKCSKCSIEKKLEEYYKRKASIDGLSFKCKECVIEYNKEYQEKHKKRLKDIREVNKEKNKEKKKEYNKEYRLKNKEKIKEKKKEYRLKNKEYHKEYFRKNKEKNNERQKVYIKERRSKDPLYKLSNNIRSLIYKTFKIRNHRKHSRTTEILGCSLEDFKIHLEKQFQDWMDWSNYGNPVDNIFELNKTWDIDHIIPLSSAETKEDIIRLNHYTNLQPLCSYTNRFIKRDNI